MIVLDTSIIGTFAVIGEMKLLLTLFGKEEVGVVPAVYAEVLQGLREGRVFLQLAADMVTEGSLRLLALTPVEVLARSKLPSSLGDGEAESIALCHSRGDAFATNDRRARNFCLSANVEVFDLVDILRALWKLGACSKKTVRALIADIEAKEGMVIKRVTEIFAH